MNEQKILAFRIEPQQQSAWCWASVAASTALYHDRHTQYSQCQIADLCLDKRLLPPHVDTFCGAPWDGNQTYELFDALTAVRTNAGHLKQSMKFDDVVAAIDEDQPIAIAVTWSGPESTDGFSWSHFLVITGYSRIGNKTFYRVADPSGYGTVHYHDAHHFMTNYGGHKTTWSESVLTKAPGGTNGPTK